jgi:pilus assembly protein CpaB
MNRRWLVPVFAAALAIVTTLAILSYLQSLRRPVAVVPQVRAESVVFAKTDITQRRVISPDQLELRQVPFTAIHPRAARRLEDVANRVALAPIFADEQVLSTMVAPVGVNAGLSYVLPKDMRAMTIPVNEVVDVAGFVFPGDRVDIIGSANDISKIFLQNVMVLAVAQKVDQKPGEDPKVTSSATIALTPDQAETLAQIDNTGKLRLALRPTGVATQVETTGKTTEAALGRPAAPAFRPVVNAESRPARAPRVGLPIVLGFGPAVGPAGDQTVELWRGTEKSTLHF